MLEIFNGRALTRRQRFFKALVYGSLAALCGILMKYLLWEFFHVYFSILYLPIGYVIAYAIQHFGHGVQIQFSILAVILTLIVIVVCDFITYHSFGIVLQMLSGNGVNSLFEIGYRGAALYLAYQYARIL